MARLETQIQQIFFTHPQNLTSSQILYEEAISESAQLFIVAEIRNVKRKTELVDLKKISEVILATFRKNKKLSAETMFENSLAEINEQLGELAHKGRSTWLSKLSAVLMLKSGFQVFLANTGASLAMLKRGSDLSHILQPEKQTMNPMKTFQNFSIGKIKDNDIVLLTLNNIFNFISLDLFGKVLNEEPDEAVNTLSKILNAAGSEEQFACFILQFTKEPQVSLNQEEIFAPLPETETPLLHSPIPARAEIWLSKIPHMMRNGIKALPKIKASAWQRLSPARKFFLSSSLIFILIFAVNLIAFALKISNGKANEKINQQITKIGDTVHEAEAALIYKNDRQAFALLSSAWDGYRDLERTAPKRASGLKSVLVELDRRVNRISEISSPQLIAELKFTPQFMVRAGSGFLLAGRETNTLSFFDKQVRNIFLINNPSEELRGIAHVSGLGHVLITADKIYLVNEQQKQVEILKTVMNANLFGIKFILPNRIYVLDKNANQIWRFNLAGRSMSEAQATIKKQASLADIIDFSLDKDLYLLSPTTVTKVVNGSLLEFKLPSLSEPLASAQKIVVASNIYVSGGNSKRLLIFDKSGGLLNQIVFPNLNNISEFVVDEQQRTIYLLDANKLYRITY